MEKQVIMDSKNRDKLLMKLTEMGMPNSSILEIVHPMKGKSHEEKEQIAAEILKKFE